MKKILCEILKRAILGKKTGESNLLRVIALREKPEGKLKKENAY